MGCQLRWCWEGGCDFEVGGRRKTAEPARRVWGEIARAMLYMTERYGVDMKAQIQELIRWHEEDPPDV